VPAPELPAPLDDLRRHHRGVLQRVGRRRHRGVESSALVVGLTLTLHNTIRHVKSTAEVLTPSTEVLRIMVYFAVRVSRAASNYRGTQGGGGRACNRPPPAPWAWRRHPRRTPRARRTARCLRRWEPPPPSPPPSRLRIQIVRGDIKRQVHIQEDGGGGWINAIGCAGLGCGCAIHRR
jgi:hypothetical protein